MSRAQRSAALVRALLTANALKPSPAGTPLAIPSFFAGWLATELAPQNLLLTSGAVLRGVVQRKGKRDKVALALNVATLAGLGLVIRQAMGSGALIDQTLQKDFPEIAPGEAEDRMALLKLHANPFNFNHP